MLLRNFERPLTRFDELTASNIKPIEQESKPRPEGSKNTCRISMV
jgi:hypothetical protein